MKQSINKTMNTYFRMNGVLKSATTDDAGFVRNLTGRNSQGGGLSLAYN